MKSSHETTNNLSYLFGENFNIINSMLFSDADIEREISENLKKPIAHDSVAYPFSSLSDRKFEIFVYSLFREEIRQSRFDGKYDDITLMTGVGEQGTRLSFIS